MAFEPDEAGGFGIGGKAIWIGVGLVLRQARPEVARHAHIKSAVFVGAEDVNVTVAHETNFTAWITGSSPVMTK